MGISTYSISMRRYSMKNHIIYKHTSPSGKSYIGQTNNYTNRSSSHRRTNSCPAFRSAIKKYGWDAFTHEILLDGLTLDEANEAEQRLITEHNTLSPNGYNLTTGGKNFLLSEEAKAKISAGNRGKKRSPETRAKISAIVNSRSPDVRAKIIASNTVRNQSPETKAKRSAAAKKRGMSAIAKAAGVAATSKQWICTSPEGVEYHITNLREFCRTHELLSHSMWLIAQGKQIQHKGWTCEYARG